MYAKHDIALLKKLNHNWGRNIVENIPQVLSSFLKILIPPYCLILVQVIFTSASPLFRPLLFVAFFVFNTTALSSCWRAGVQHTTSPRSSKPVSLSCLPHCLLLNMQSSEEVFREKCCAKSSGNWFLPAKSVCQKVLGMK